MKILIDARLYGLENAGVGRYLINLVDELSKLEKNEKYVILLKRKYFNTLNLPGGWKKILADFGHYSFSEQFKLTKLINAEDPDVVHFPHFNIPIKYKGNFVVTIHDMTMHRQGIVATKLPLPVYLAKRIPYKYTFRKAVMASKKIIVPSKSVKKDLVEYFKIDDKKITVTYEGVDQRLAKEGSVDQIPSIPLKYNLKRKKYLFYVGNAYPHKNLKRVVEAVKYLNEERQIEIVFAIASSKDSFIKDLSKEISKQKADEYVRLLGFVPDVDLAKLYRNSLGFIYPSLAEGFGLPGIEAMNAGTLVLASNIRVFREVYGNNASYFNPFDFSSIAKTIEGAYKLKSKQRSKIITKSQKYISRYSWENTAKQTFKVYRDTLRAA